LRQRPSGETYNEPWQKEQTIGEHIIALQTLPTVGIHYKALRFFSEFIDAGSSAHRIPL